MKLSPADSKIREHFRFYSFDVCLPYTARRGNRHTLGDVYRELGFTKGAEIGVHVGLYAKVILDKIPGLNLTCVDSWEANSRYSQTAQDGFYAETVKALAGYPGVKILRLTSMKALEHVEDGSLDFVFVDGNHEYNYVAPDIIFWAQKVRRGGIVAVHDYMRFYHSGVVQAVDAYTYCNRIDPWYLTREREPTAFWVKQ